MPEISLVRAIVTDNRDPDKWGRVKVRYPWLGGNSGQQPRDWALVSRPVSHKGGAGDWFLPDIGDCVLVGFEMGERSNPIVMGSLLPEHGTLPKSGRPGDANDDTKNTLRFIKTNGGHLLAFDDTSGDRSIQLKDDMGQSLTIGTDKKEVEIKHSKGHGIKMTEGGVDVHDSGGQTVKIDASGGNIIIKNKGGCEIKLTPSGIVIKSSGTITLDDSAGISLGQSASEAMIKGTQFMQYLKLTFTRLTGKAKQSGRREAATYRQPSSNSSWPMTRSGNSKFRGTIVLHAKLRTFI